MPPSPEAAPRRRLALWLAAAALAASGCGSLPAEELPPAATPAASPALAAAPAGRVVPVGPEPIGVGGARLTTTEMLVALRERDAVLRLDVSTGRVVGPRVSRSPEAPFALGRAVTTVDRRTFQVDERANVLRALEDGREVARARTGLQPAGVALVDEGRQVGVLSVRERVLELFDARTLERTGWANAGTGPANVASDGGNYLYITDTIAGALLVFRILPELSLVRRYRLAGSPYAIAFGGEGLLVTLTATNELVELSAGRRPRELRRFPSVRQPSGVAEAPGSGRVFVTGAAQGVVQLLDPPPLPRSR